MIKVRVNQKSVSAKLEGLLSKIEEQEKQKLEDMASYLISVSPVDTGAYMLSHSIVPSGSGGGRLRSSENKPKFQNYGTVAAEAMQQLNSDIKKLDLKNSSGVLFRNRSLHAPDVETGNNWTKTEGYFPYTKLKDKFR